MLKIKTAQIYWRKINSGQLKGRAKEKSYAKILLFFINTKYSFSILEQILFTQNVFQWFKHSCNLLNISVFHIWVFVIRIKKKDLLMNDLIISRYTKQYTKVLQALQKKNFIKNLNQSMLLYGPFIYEILYRITDDR